MRILIADDEPVSLRMLEKTLQRAGYQVTAVRDGRAAIEELCSPEGPRLALLDWMMPEFDGPAVCREVRGRRGERHVHLVLLTSRNSKQDVVSAWNLARMTTLLSLSILMSSRRVCTRDYAFCSWKTIS